MNHDHEIRKRGGTGILTDRDIEDFSEAMKRVYALMSDYAWHTSEEICFAAGENGKPAARGLARLFDLKSAGHPYEKQKIPGSKRLWRYRLKRNATAASEQIPLFLDSKTLKALRSA